MSNKILFVFEGDRTEEQIVSNLQNFFLNEDTTVKCVYGAEIYQIYREIVVDQDLDTFNLIKDRSEKNQTILSNYKRDDFAEIYLFFDYDGHSSLADDEKLKELLNFFDEETDKGKLFVSYPMVEALKHITEFDTFNELVVECKKKIGYKEVVHKSCINHLRDFTKYDFDIWKRVIYAHLFKLNYIVNNTNSLPSEIIVQSVILERQLEKFIMINSTIAVLSAFPIFLHDYYGNDEIKRRIE